MFAAPEESFPPLNAQSMEYYTKQLVPTARKVYAAYEMARTSLELPKITNKNNEILKTEEIHEYSVVKFGKRILEILRKEYSKIVAHHSDKKVSDLFRFLVPPPPVLHVFETPEDDFPSSHDTSNYQHMVSIARRVYNAYETARMSLEWPKLVNRKRHRLKAKEINENSVVQFGRTILKHLKREYSSIVAHGADKKVADLFRLLVPHPSEWRFSDLEGIIFQIYRVCKGISLAACLGVPYYPDGDIPQDKTAIEDLVIRRNDELAKMMKKSSVKLLEIGPDKLFCFPTSVFSAHNLLSLTMKSLKIPSLGEIGQLANLRILEIFECPLDTLPSSLGDLSQLQGLHIQGSGITEFPCEEVSVDNRQVTVGVLHKLTALKILILRANKLRSLPGSLGCLTNLEALDVSKNCISSLVQDDVDRLSLQMGQLQISSPHMWQLPNLQRLHASENCISVLPWLVSQLPSLTKLDLQRNSLVRIEGGPKSRPLFLALRECNLSHNKLESNSFPAKFFSNTTLRRLQLSDNLLTTFDPPVSGLSSLTSLDLSDNNMQSFPKWLTQLSSLKEAFLEGNAFTKLPSTFLEMPSLRELWVSNSMLASVKGVADVVRRGGKESIYITSPEHEKQQEADQENPAKTSSSSSSTASPSSPSSPLSPGTRMSLNVGMERFQLGKPAFSQKQ
jgi:Leucine-rich repeat (LRR) protein